MKSSEIRQKFLTFFENRGHKIVPSSSLVPDDPSVLLTTAGMQQFKPYYLDAAVARREFGGYHTASIQKCFRTTDIDEVGDDTHLTFFEMLGNFSFGGYGKGEAIAFAHEFIARELNLPIAYVTVFGGGRGVPADDESEKIWRELGVKDVRREGIDDVFWGPTGNAGPCGPTTEIYCENAAGKTVEIWNVVFNQFFYNGTREDLLAGAAGKRLEPLPQLGIDTGMGLERLAMVAQSKKNIFESDLFLPLLERLGDNGRSARIVADHLRAATFLIADGVTPTNTDRGYILRRLIRRAVRHARQLKLEGGLSSLVPNIIQTYGNHYQELGQNLERVVQILNEEENKFAVTLERGLKEFERGTDAFTLFTSYGFPLELTAELAREQGREINIANFEAAMREHRDVSRTGLDKKFVGGLANHEPSTIKLHTAHHLLLAALKRVLGVDVKQRGSNINEERLRLDFSFARKLTDGEKQAIEALVNEKIKEDLPVIQQNLPKTEAEKLGAEMEFGTKYGDVVSVYTIGQGDQVFSREFCGGPHVGHTGEIGGLKILKEEPSAAGVRRIKAKLI